MRVYRLEIDGLRGLDSVVVRPGRHAVVVGPRGGGKTNLLEALSRVLDWEVHRQQPLTELDFSRLRTDEPIRIEVTIGTLGHTVEQDLLDYLEPWDPETGTVTNPETTDISADAEWVLRVAFRGTWDHERERADEHIYLPKFSEPDEGRFRHIRREELDALGYSRVTVSSLPFRLSNRGTFRALVEDRAEGQLAVATEEYLAAVQDAAAAFGAHAPIRDTVDELTTPIAPLITPGSIAPRISFTADSSSAANLLRALSPTVDLGSGALPLNRHGKTTAGLFRVLEAVAATQQEHSLLAIDDLTDEVDAASVAPVITALLQRSGQVWITSRDPSVARYFGPDAVVRIDVQRETTPARQLKAASSRDEMRSLRFWHTAVPALGSRTAVIVEGHHDLLGYASVLHKILIEEHVDLLASADIALLGAGAAHDAGGGESYIPRLARIVAALGMRVVAVVDGDVEISDRFELCDTVIRLPNGCAIERALFDGLPDEDVRTGLTEITRIKGGNADHLPGLNHEELRAEFIRAMKASPGWHDTFVASLSTGSVPPLARKVLARVVRSVQDGEEGWICDIE